MILPLVYELRAYVTTSDLDHSFEYNIRTLQASFLLL